LLTRSIGQRGPEAARYIRHTPGGAQAAGCIYLLKMCPDGLGFVNPGLLRLPAVAQLIEEPMQEPGGDGDDA
jgi:hypothetical protein